MYDFVQFIDCTICKVGNGFISRVNEFGFDYQGIHHNVIILFLSLIFRNNYFISNIRLIVQQHQHYVHVLGMMNNNNTVLIGS